MKALFTPSRLGLEMLGNLPGDLAELPEHSKSSGTYLFTGESIAAIREKQGIVPSRAGVAVAQRLAEAAIPELLTKAQMLVQLLADGKITDADATAVETLIKAAIPEGVVVAGVSLQTATIIRFRESVEFHFSHAQVRQFAALLGYTTEEQYRAFFAHAAAR